MTVIVKSPSELMSSPFTAKSPVNVVLPVTASVEVNATAPSAVIAPIPVMSPVALMSQSEELIVTVSPLSPSATVPLATSPFAIVVTPSSPNVTKVSAAESTMMRSAPFMVNDRFPCPCALSTFTTAAAAPKLLYASSRSSEPAAAVVSTQSDATESYAYRLPSVVLKYIRPPKFSASASAAASLAYDSMERLEKEYATALIATRGESVSPSTLTANQSGTVKSASSPAASRNPSTEPSCALKYPSVTVSVWLSVQSAVPPESAVYNVKTKS